MAATAIKSRLIKKPDPAQRQFAFHVPPPQVRLGIGKPIVEHELNYRALDERIDELGKKFPNEDNLRDKAWAMALDEQLRASVRLSGKKLLIGNDFNLPFSFTKLAEVLNLSLGVVNQSASNFAIAAMMWAIPTALVALTGVRPSDMRFSLFPPGSRLHDRYVALSAMTRVTTLIKYKK